MERVSKKAVLEVKDELKIEAGDPEAAKADTAAPAAAAAQGDEEMKDESKAAASKGKKEETKTAEEDHDTAEDTDEVAFETKVAFTEQVRKLNNDGLNKLVRKVKELCRSALEDVDDDKLHI